MKKLLILSACLWALGSSPVFAQTGEPNVVVVQAEYQGFGNVNIRISRGEANTQVMTIKDRDNAVVEAIQKLVTQLYQQGYSFKGEAPIGSTAVAHSSLLLFVKEH